MSDKDPSLRRNAPKLELHVPEPAFRPGDTPDFSKLKIPAAGTTPRPDIAAPAAETHPLTTDLVRVLGEEDKAVGPWDPKLDRDTLRKMLPACFPVPLLVGVRRDLPLDQQLGEFPPLRLGLEWHDERRCIRAARRLPGLCSIR